MKLIKYRCNKDVKKYFWEVSKWNSLDDVTVTAKSANGFKSKLENEIVKKTGPFLFAGPTAEITVIRSSHPGSTCPTRR